MSSPLDMVGVAMEDVRISVDALTLDDRVRLFGKIADHLHSHFSRDYKGGGSFVEWEKENFSETEWTQHTVRRHALVIDRTLWPKQEDYSPTTRIVSLTCEAYNQKYQEMKATWKVGDTKVVFRFCVTNTGSIFLERYEGTITEIDPKYAGVPAAVVVNKTKFHEVGQFFRENEAKKELHQLLQKQPFELLRFGLGVTSLLAREAEERERRAERDRKSFNILNGKLRHFHMAHP